MVLAVLLAALISIIGASSIRIANAGFLNDALPAAFVSARPGNCTLLGPKVNTGHCYFSGYYLGESGQWLFLVWEPTAIQIGRAEADAGIKLRAKRSKLPPKKVRAAERKAGEKFKNRLVLIPRDDVLQVLVADRPGDLPEVQLSSKPNPSRPTSPKSRRSPRAEREQ